MLLVGGRVGGGGVHELKSLNLSLSQEQRGGTSNSKRTVGGFKVDMKLEAKDRLHPTLVCVATITDIKDEQLLIHFDGYWCKLDSTALHPRGWCSSHRVEQTTAQLTLTTRSLGCSCEGEKLTFP